MSLKNKKFIYLTLIIFTFNHLYISWHYFNQSCCEDTYCVTKKNIFNKSHLLFILIPSAPKNYPNREAIRNTWGNTISNYDSINYAFIIGNIGVSESEMSALLEEKDKFGDIVILDGVEEEYTKLTRKVLKAFAWAGEHIDAVYYFKTDDDCYIVIDNVYETLTKGSFGTEKIIFGHMMVRSAVLKEGRWGELGWFLCEIVYLPYPSGLGYIMTKDVVEFLKINSDRLMIYNNEDASLGSWVAGLNLNYVNDPRVVITPKPCLPSVWAIHGYTHEEFAEIHSSLLNATLHCS